MRKKCCKIAVLSTSLNVAHAAWGPMVNALGSWSRGPGSSAGRGRPVEFLGKSLNFHITLVHSAA